MEQREVRNEFGLDELNAQDVRNERAKRYLPWVLGAVVIFAVSGMIIFAMSGRGIQTALGPGSQLSTTGSAPTMPPPAAVPGPGPTPQR